MELFAKPRIDKREILKWLAIVVLFFLLVFWGYIGPRLGKIAPEILRKLPAQILKPFEEKPKTEEIASPAPEAQAAEEKKYTEVAQKGEGITHLARRALKKYLQDEPQDFQVTPEHKVYIEDYLAKKLGGRWLKLGETLEFSEDLIKEAIEKSETLSPAQLENLTQYSQLVPSLNY